MARIGESRPRRLLQLEVAAIGTTAIKTMDEIRCSVAKTFFETEKGTICPQQGSTI
jgi:hypothetical protein